MGWGITLMEIQNNHYGGCVQNGSVTGQTERDKQVQEAGAMILARDSGTLSQGAGANRGWWILQAQRREDAGTAQWLRAQALGLNLDPAILEP